MKLKRQFKINLILIFILIFLIPVGILYIFNNWRKNVKYFSEKSLLIAKISAAGIDGEMIKMLKALPEDERTIAYESIKKRLESYLKADKNLRFVYLYTKKGDDLYFMVDSEPASSADYSPPGQEYFEAADYYKKPFLNKEPIIIGPVKDRWGNWMSVLVPIINKETREVFAVLAMDYPAEKWNTQAINSTIALALDFLVIYVLVFIIFIFFIILINKDRKFISLVENIPGAVYRCKIDKNWTMVYISDQIFNISGFPISDFINNSVRSYASIIHFEDIKIVGEKINEGIVLKKDFVIEYRLVSANKKIIWVKEKGRAIYNKSGKAIYLDGVIFDISKEKEIISKLKFEEEKSKKINRYMVNRELKMIELKKKIRLLEKKDEN